MVGWGTSGVYGDLSFDLETFEIELKNSLYGVCAFLEGKIIGTVRLVGDGSICFYIQDVIVKPEHQRMRIGEATKNKVMDFINENAYQETIVGLMAVKGKEEFYEKFGFWNRHNDIFGLRMMHFWE